MLLEVISSWWPSPVSWSSASPWTSVCVLASHRTGPGTYRVAGTGSGSCRAAHRAWNTARQPVTHLSTITNSHYVDHPRNGNTAQQSNLAGWEAKGFNYQSLAYTDLLASKLTTLVESQKGLTTCDFNIRLYPFASELTKCRGSALVSSQWRILTQYIRKNSLFYCII